MTAEDHPHRSPDLVGVPRWLLASIGAVLSLLLMGVVGWAATVQTSVATLRADVAVLKSQDTELDRRLSRIEDKLDLLLSRTVFQDPDGDR